jgi:hypothetical protein
MSLTFECTFYVEIHPSIHPSVRAPILVKKGKNPINRLVYAVNFTGLWGKMPNKDQRKST